MRLKKGDFASASGPYIRADGSEVKPLKYLEVVKVLVPANKYKEVYVEGLDSQEKFWVLESSLTYFPNKEWTADE